MDLILWRHADAEDGIPDSERRLTGKGEKQARHVAAWLAARLPGDYVVLASPARRTRETARALAREFTTMEALGTGTTPQRLLEAAGWPEGRGTVVVVGHQPTLGRAAALVLTGTEEPWSVRKGALWWLRSREGEVTVRAVIGPDLL